MTYDDLAKSDVFGAFINYLPLSQAKVLGVIPKEFHNIIEDKCPCGSDKIIRKVSRSEVRCVDPRCPYKLPFYLNKALSTVGVKGVGPETCKKAMQEYYSEEFNSHIKLLSLEQFEGYEYLNNHERFVIQDALKAFRSKYVTYAELIANLSIPEFGASSTAIFKGIKNTQHLMEVIEQDNGYASFMSKRGVHDPMKLYYFREFVMDIYDYEVSIKGKINIPSENEIDIVTTGALTYQGRRVYNSDFIELCNQVGILPNGQRLFSIRDTEAVASVDFVVCEEGFSSRKANSARERQSYSDKKILYTPDEFVEHLLSVRNAFMERSGIVE